MPANTKVPSSVCSYRSSPGDLCLFLPTRRCQPGLRTPSNTLAFPASVEDALDRALLILAGGALQVLSAAFLLRAFDQLSNHLTSLARYVRKEETALHSALLETA